MVTVGASLRDAYATTPRSIRTGERVIPAGYSFAALGEVAVAISEGLVPNNREHESKVYPGGVAELLGGIGPLAPMSCTRQEIFHLALELNRIVDDASVDGFGDEDCSEA